MRNCAKSSTPPAARPISLKAKPRLRGVRLRGASLRFALLVYSQQPAAAENAFALRDAWKIVICTAARTPAQARLARGLPQEALTYEADVDRIYLNSSTSRCVGPTGQAEASALLKWFTEPFDMVAENALSPPVAAAEASGFGESQIWLGRKDSNLRMPESKSGALPLGDAPTGPKYKGFRVNDAPLGARRRRTIGPRSRPFNAP